MDHRPRRVMVAARLRSCGYLLNRSATSALWSERDIGASGSHQALCSILSQERALSWCQGTLASQRGWSAQSLTILKFVCLFFSLQEALLIAPDSSTQLLKWNLTRPCFYEWSGRACLQRNPQSCLCHSAFPGCKILSRQTQINFPKISAHFKKYKRSWDKSKALFQVISQGGIMLVNSLCPWDPTFVIVLESDGSRNIDSR